MTHKHEGKGECVWCTLTRAMSANYGPHNPLPLDRAIQDVAAMLVHRIASIDEPNDRIDAVREWAKNIKKAVPIARRNGRYYTAGQNVHPLSGTVQ